MWEFAGLTLSAIIRHSGFFSKPATQPGSLSRHQEVLGGDSGGFSAYRDAFRRESGD
jgi:hypothetical protein